jgi:hypothetical protein
MKHNTLRLEKRDFTEMIKYKSTLLKMLSNYSRTCNVHIPTYRRCTYGWKRRCYSIDIKPHPHFAVVESMDEEDDLLEAE